MKLVPFVIIVCGSIYISRAKFTECDLDLEDPLLFARLPAECQNLDDASKALMLEESEAFRTFHDKLLGYEAAQGKDTEDGAYMDMKFRSELYGGVDIYLCLTIDESLAEYVKCLTEKRQLMIGIIDAKMQSV
ncbi:uncharacterized protein LOC131216698 [Anopheles bellator]|uniref:uncharacterized protein LOC131216698 n=1 Tax=Anopheles bellator TaxID=139047 RepID=UPI0026483085|nr:uncharacterized protein LOC131216698 [Anopheles bellator]